ncbi:MAG: MBL fold metallo-hydrolase [Peptococcaceae bacterium]|nr:MBL fold metallo-hydrolase [Peptococcaceae bacterium]
MSPLEIKVHNIGGYMVKNYLLETPMGIIAIDTGYPGGAKKFIRRFVRRWPLSELKYIFLTHHHDDHAGFLADLLEAAGAKVILHPLAAGFLERGRSAEPPGAGYSSAPASLFSLFKKDFSFPPVKLDGRAIFVEHEEDQFFMDLGLPVRILFLPGHTADSLGLFLVETGQLFCGDAAMNAVISIARHTIWIEDVREFGRSWDKMLSLDPTKIYPSHGTPFPPEDLVKYRDFMKGRSLIPPR